jgi:protein associated with RNAse G/E
MSGLELSFIDLDLDLLLHNDGTYSILDEDEFQINAQLFAYPAEICAVVRQTMTELVKEIKAGRFPNELIRYVD